MIKSLISSSRSSKQNFNCTIIDHISNEIISNTPEYQDRPKIPQEKKKDTRVNLRCSRIDRI